MCESAAGWSSTESFSDMHGMMSCQLMSHKPCFIVRAGDLQALKEKTFAIKEGVKYRLKIDFKVRWMDAVTELCWERMIYWRQQGSIIVQIYIYIKSNLIRYLQQGNKKDKREKDSPGCMLYQTTVLKISPLPFISLCLHCCLILQWWYSCQRSTFNT